MISLSFSLLSPLPPILSLPLPGFLALTPQMPPPLAFDIAEILLLAGFVKLFKSPKISATMSIESATLPLWPVLPGWSSWLIHILDPAVS